MAHFIYYLGLLFFLQHILPIILLSSVTQNQCTDLFLFSSFLRAKGYLHLCPRMNFLSTLRINDSLYTNYENVFIELDS